MLIDERTKKAINKFYEYKSNYEQERQDKIDKIHKKYADNNGEIQKQLAKFKQSCIYCKRSVNTQFIKKGNRLIIMCGDKNMPCPDKLEIVIPNFIHINDGIQQYNKSLEELRQKIIKIRADLTYEFIDEEEAINEFQNLNDEFNTDSEFYTGLLLYKGNIEENKEREHMMISKISEINRLKQASSQLLQKYAKTHTQQLLQDYIELIKCKVFPQKQQLQNLRYSFQEIISREINTGEERAGTIEYKLFQRPNLFELYQHIWASIEDPTVLQNGKKKDSVNSFIVEDSEETKRNQNNEEDDDDGAEDGAEDGTEDDGTNNNNAGGPANNNNNNNNDNNDDNNSNNNNEDLEEVVIDEGNIAPQNEVIELRPKTNEYETDSDDDNYGNGNDEED